MINKEVYKIIDFIVSKDGIGNKSVLIEEVQKLFGLTKDRSVYYSENVAIRFSSSNSLSFGNTVLSLSNLQKYDELPFIVCLVTPNKNFVYLANTTFLQKVSHSSQLLRVDNIRGSFNGSDIVKDFNGLTNSPDNFQKLFSIHEEIGFSGNLIRLVEATTGISPSGKKQEVSVEDKVLIKLAPERAIKFINSKETIKWLNDNGIKFDDLYMRFTNDLRKDSIVKQEIYEMCIKDKYNVLFVLDDRDQVVNMWREQGLKCLQVAEGNF